MTQNSLNRKFEKWLGDSRNEAYLDKLIESIHSTMKKRRLFLWGMPPHDENYNKGYEKRFREELKQECLIFLLEDQSMLSNLMGRNGFGLVKSGLNQKLVDLSLGQKDIQKDTWRLFRKHILRVLGESDLFVKTEEKRGDHYFGRTPDTRQAAISAEEEETLAAIAYPPDLPLLFADLNTRNNILKAAEYFWASAPQALNLAYTDISLSEKMFIKWLGKHVELQARIQSGETCENDDALPGILETSPELTAFNDTKKRTLIIWAQKCFNYLQDNEKYLFFYFICKNLKHDAVSKLMGKKASMSYQRGKMIKRLQTFLRPLEWVSPDSDKETMDTADLDFFRSQLCTDLHTWHAQQEKA